MRAAHNPLCRAGSFLLMALLPAALAADDRREATVGMAAHIDQLVLPGSELEVRPIDERRPRLVLRITGVFAHGTAHRYDFLYYGLEPGIYDLRPYLRRKDGSSTSDLPPIPVTIRSVLPPGQIEPHTLALSPAPFLGGYRLALVLGGALWLVGLAVLLFARRRVRQPVRAASRAPLSLAEQLRPLVEGAMSGRLSEADRAGLERLLLAYWRRRLRLNDMPAHETFAVLRRHGEAGPLLQHLEQWLHRPGLADPVDLAVLLRPYQDLPPEMAEPLPSQEAAAS